MTRLLLLCALVGAAFFYLREPAPRPVRFASDAPLVIPAAVLATPAPTPSVEEPAESAVTAAAVPVPEPAPRAAGTLAKRAAPIPTSPAPTAIAVLDSPSAGLPARNAAAPRLTVTEILPDGTSRAAGGPTEPALPFARQLARRPAAEAVVEAAPAKPAPESAPSVAATVAAPAPPRPNQADAFFKNAARILAETEIPK